MSRLLPMLALIATVLLSPAAVGATEPVSGGGGFTVDSAVVTSTRVVDGNTFLTSLVTSTLTGTLEGTTVGEETAVVHPNGLIIADTFETFTGTVDGSAGTAVLRVVGTVDAASGALSGQFTIVEGTGGLANLRGQGTIQGVGDAGTYTADIHFEPAP